MSHFKTGNNTHDTTVLTAESVRQGVVNTSGASQATIKAADIAYFRAAIASANIAGFSTSQFVVALRELGTGGA